MASKQKRLAMARKARSQAARVMIQLAHSEISVKEIILKNPRSMRSVRLWTVLCRTPHLGETGARKVCETAGVWPETRLGNLTERERLGLVKFLPPRVK
jgi:hypothetical protein